MTITLDKVPEIARAAQSSDRKMRGPEESSQSSSSGELALQEEALGISLSAAQFWLLPVNPILSRVRRACCRSPPPNTREDVQLRDSKADFSHRSCKSSRRGQQQRSAEQQRPGLGGNRESQRLASEGGSIACRQLLADGSMTEDSVAVKMPKAAAPCNQQQERQQLIQSFAVSPVPQYIHCISFQEDSALPLFMNYSADFQLVKSRRKKKNLSCSRNTATTQSDSFLFALPVSWFQPIYATLIFSKLSN